MRLFLMMIVLLVTQTSVLARDASLPPAIAQALRAQGLPQDSLSVFAQDLNNDDVVLSFNADQARQPASTIKTVTTFVALDVLGPAYTWKTRAFVDGTLKDGVLNGDLIIAGGGDPYMTAERWWRFVTGIRQQGVKTITGDIVIDRSYFASENDDRATFDGEPEKSYNVIPDALLVNFQTSQFTLTGELDGNSAALTVDPLPANLDVENQVHLRGHNCRRGYRDLRITTPSGANGRRIDISGVAAHGCGSITVTRAIMTAPEYAYGTFRTYFEQQGGHIRGGLRLKNLTASATLLYTQESLTLGEIIRLINKYSNNVMARTLLLTLGAEKYGSPATQENGRRVINDWLQSHHIDNHDWVIDNGSGLSRIERVTASGMAAVLKTAWQSQWMPEFAASLPLAATDGTLRNRFQASGMRGRLRMKTGHLDDVTSLAGYVNAASGRNFVVTILINHPAAIYGGDEVQAAILRWLFAQ
ncbi:MAG TPA: D-alanyl-D-alanine carboxypeptidase/D-alanyl-D-alanine-endopeptidase [Steroidobacteraceae bacterium]|nr:D-alanyl-D-alanine carboxypeptidase/D-alanyl-D-alanine-endopeptidase [Steroidobacteraceae bacterium]